MGRPIPTLCHVRIFSSLFRTKLVSFDTSRWTCKKLFYCCLSCSWTNFSNGMVIILLRYSCMDCLFSFIIDFMALNLVRFYYLKKLMPFSIRQFIRNVVLPCLHVSIVSFIVPLAVCHYMERGLLRFFINVPIAVLWTGICCILFGLTKNERLFFWNKAKSLLSKIGI